MCAKLIDRAGILTDPIAAVEAYAGQPTIAMDLETSGLDRHADEVMVVSLAAPGLPPVVLHVAGRIPEQVIDLLNKTRLIGHNITAFDIPFLSRYGYDVCGSAGWLDTMIAEQLCIVTDRRGVSKSLKATAKRRINVEIDKGVDHAGWIATTLTDEQVSYAAADVVYLHRVHEAQIKRLAELKLEAAWEVEQIATRATSMLAVNGIPVKSDEVRHHADLVHEEMLVSKDGLDVMAGRSFNPGSSVQVKKVLAEEFGTTVESTDVSALRELMAKGGPIATLAKEIQAYRKLKKASMYDEAWASKNISDDGRIRSSYWQLGTDTGRYSCSQPNLQQWPRALRGLIGYPEGSDRLMLSVDYSQIEILIAALLCREPRLIEAVIDGDVHTFVGSLVFHIPEAEVDKRHRTMAKAASFTLLFAGGVPGIMESAAKGDVALTVDEAREVRGKFFAAFPAVNSYINGTRAIVDYRQRINSALNVRVPNGPLRSLFGKSLTASTVVNTLVQGAAAVGLKRALGQIIANGFGQYLCAVVHDEVVLDVPRNDAVEIQRSVEKCLQDGMEQTIGVRPKVGSTLGLQWS